MRSSTVHTLSLDCLYISASRENFAQDGVALSRPSLAGTNLIRTIVDRLVANTGGVIMTTFDVFSSVLLPAPSPALPEAMAGATSMGGYLDTARATQLVDIVR